jgi:hypothetical protein
MRASSTSTVQAAGQRPLRAWNNSGFILQSAVFHTALVTLQLFMTGCGYTQMGNNNASLYRQDIHTVAIPIFVNRTYRRGLETELTKSVIQQLEEHSPYKVVPRERAETILDCEIVAVTTSTLSFDEFSGLPQDQMIAMVVSFTWKNLRTGEILVQRRNFDQRAEFFPALGESESAGETDAIQNLALAMVQELQADW